MSTTPRPLHPTTPSRPLSIPAFRHASMALGKALSWLGALPHDSRDTLPSKDTDLAAYGITWSTDLAHETELAQELAKARRQRLAGTSPVPVTPLPQAEVSDAPALAVPAPLGVA